jgi:hypothetical protein
VTPCRIFFLNLGRRSEVENNGVAAFLIYPNAAGDAHDMRELPAVAMS